MTKLSLLKAALGEEKADSVFKNATVFNPFTCKWKTINFAVKDGIVLGEGDYEGFEEIDLAGAKVLPGLIDAHVHIESSLLTPGEYGRLVLTKGTTTVFADPHEIANVAGKEGIRYMLAESRKTPLDIFFMLPSCVPATPADMGGAILNSDDLKEFSEYKEIIGLGEMMNYPGVLSGDSEVYKKLNIFNVIDGHCPLLSGRELNAYILQGISSEHECTNKNEACEKLEKGMYIMIREGSTEKNLLELIPVVNPLNVSRFMFATDDRHADMLVNEGHIDDCIRKAVAAGLKPELAYRMATLSAAERFCLFDRGALTPGRVADFCIIDDVNQFRVIKTYKSGLEIKDIGHVTSVLMSSKFNPPVLKRDDLKIYGNKAAHVVGLINGQIITRSLIMDVNSEEIPDLKRDIVKCVVCDRYRGNKTGIGLVKGIGIKRGAIASSVSHDSHNIVSVGCSDDDIISAINLLRESKGGLSVFVNGNGFVLPLECGGIMSSRSYEEVYLDLNKLNEVIKDTGCIENPFMYLSFLALSVIPEIRITERGVFDAVAFMDIPLFDKDS
ncbi:MAG: adenine deaminase [Methanomicrobiaceae archaeon]|nr:adenine deaminase [Methanomicrobiaceae archaeon]